MKLREAGVLVTLNTDDPTVSGIDLNHEWKLARSEYALTKDQQKQLLRNSAALAFCSDKERTALMQKVDATLPL
jgi:adenosine deaminase